MLTLSLDTTASTLSVALLDDKKILAKKTIFEAGKQSELLICEIEKILKENKIWYQNLDLIAAINGPGSFTGVRIGLASARTIKLATNLPLIVVNSCEVIAYKYRNNSGKILVLLDAKMDEFFAAEFFAENGKIIQITEPELIRVDEVLKITPQDDFFLCGSGKKIVAEILKCEINNEEDLVEADLVGLLAYEKFQEGKISENFDPLYLRMPKIEMRKK